MQTQLMGGMAGEWRVLWIGRGRTGIWIRRRLKIRHQVVVFVCVCVCSFEWEWWDHLRKILRRLIRIVLTRQTHPKRRQLLRLRSLIPYDRVSFRVGDDDELSMMMTISFLWTREQCICVCVECKCEQRGNREWISCGHLCLYILTHDVQLPNGLQVEAGDVGIFRPTGDRLAVIFGRRHKAQLRSSGIVLRLILLDDRHEMEKGYYFDFSKRFAIWV